MSGGDISFFLAFLRKDPAILLFDIHSLLTLRDIFS